MSLAALDSVAERDNAAAVAAFSRRAVHPIGGPSGELAAVVVGYDGLDVVAEEVRLSFDNRDERDAESIEPPANHQQVNGVAAEAVDLVDPQLLEPTGNRVF